jgi:hypothetical protein
LGKNKLWWRRQVSAQELETFEKEWGIEPGGHLSVPRKDLPGLLHRTRTQN